MRDYKKVQIQLENLETSVRDRCKKEFTGTVQFMLLTSRGIKLITKLKLFILIFRPDDGDDGHVQRFGGFGDSLPRLSGLRGAYFFPWPPGVATETRPGRSRESEADGGARAGSAVQSA